MKYIAPYRLGKDELDLGIDLYSVETRIIKRGSTVIVDTGTSFEFPIFGKLRRFISKLLFGIEITGIGGILRPRGVHKHDILAGVVDAGYRGTVKVKIFNPSANEDIFVCRGDSVAQMIPIFVINMPLTPSGRINEDTKRGYSGGINVRG
jgi:dUTPase